MEPKYHAEEVIGHHNHQLRISRLMPRHFLTRKKWQFVVSFHSVFTGFPPRKNSVKKIPAAYGLKGIESKREKMVNLPLVSV